jgi:predicted RNA-binding Zn ribbon-like protein
MPASPAFHFLLLGEPVTLDLVNTRVRRQGETIDLLDTPAALGAWLRCEHERLPWASTVTHNDRAAGHDLRDAATALLDALRRHAHAPASALRHLNAVLAYGRAAPLQLDWIGTQPRLVAPKARTRRGALLHALATDTVALLTGPDAGRVRQCAHPDCILRFVATNPRRRWCRTATCGNRARVARHYLRHHEAH